MGNTSYTAHISNKKSTITSKSKLLGVAKHNLRKYKSDDYSKDNIMVLRGTDDLLQDVKNVYHQEFDEVIKEYNEKQKRADRKIDDYFEHVAGLEQDMAVEIIFQCGDKEFWKAHDDVKHDCEQLLGSRNWFREMYPANFSVPILIHNSYIFDKDCFPSEDTRIITPDLLEKLKSNVQDFCTALCKKENYMIEEKIEGLIKYYNLEGRNFVNNYTRKYKK